MTQEEPVRGDIIRKALDGLDILGRTVKEMIIEDIERSEITLDNKHYYPLRQIEERLIELFGEDGASLLIKRLRERLETLKSFIVVSLPTVGLLLSSFL